MYNKPPSVVRVRGRKDVPTLKHYAVLIYKSDSVTIPGDERSRTNPGHGYPEHTETFDTFEHYVTINKEDWVKLIELIMADKEARNRFVAFEVNKLASVSSKVIVEG